MKSTQEAYEKLIKMSRNDDFTPGNLLDYQKCHEKYHENIIKLLVVIHQDK